jgi:hypothetical protein
MKPWFNWLLVVAMTAVAIGLGIYAFRYISRPVALSIAIGPRDGEDFRLVSAIARWLATNNSAVQLHIVPQDSPTDATAAISAGQVNLADQRDLPVPSNVKPW